MADNKSGGMTFRRINGRIIPIRAAQLALGASAAIGIAESSRALRKARSKPRGSQVAPNRGLQALGFGSAVADGVISGLTLASGAKRFLLGQGVSLGLSAGSSAANIASFAGKGHARARIVGAARQEAINTLVGNAAFVGTAFAVPSSRKAIIETAAKALNFFKGKVGAFL